MAAKEVKTGTPADPRRCDSKTTPLAREWPQDDPLPPKIVIVYKIYEISALYVNHQVEFIIFQEILSFHLTKKKSFKKSLSSFISVLSSDSMQGWMTFLPQLFHHPTVARSHVHKYSRFLFIMINTPADTHTHTQHTCTHAHTPKLLHHTKASYTVMLQQSS